MSAIENCSVPRAQQFWLWNCQQLSSRKQLREAKHYIYGTVFLSGEALAHINVFLRQHEGSAYQRTDYVAAGTRERNVPRCRCDREVRCPELQTGWDWHQLQTEPIAAVFSHPGWFPGLEMLPVPLQGTCCHAPESSTSLLTFRHVLKPGGLWRGEVPSVLGQPALVEKPRPLLIGLSPAARGFLFESPLAFFSSIFC